MFRRCIVVQVTGLRPTQIPIHSVKVMLSLCTPCRHTLGGLGEGRAPLIFNLGTKCEWSVSSTGRLTPGVRYPDTH
jgi:hypothetical protein